MEEELKRLEAEKQASSRAWRDAFDSMHQREMNAERGLEEAKRLIVGLDEHEGAEGWSLWLVNDLEAFWRDQK